MKSLNTFIISIASVFTISTPALSNPQSLNVITTQEAAYFDAEYNRMVNQANETMKANGSLTSDAWVRATVTRYVNKQLTCMGSEAPQDKLECKRNKEEFTEALAAAAKKSKT